MNLILLSQVVIVICIIALVISSLVMGFFKFFRWVHGIKELGEAELKKLTFEGVPLNLRQSVKRIEPDRPTESTPPAPGRT